MSFRQLVAWLHFDQLEPWPETRADVHHQHKMAIFGNANRDSKKRRKPFTASDFALPWQRPQRSQPLTSQSAWERVKAQAKQLHGVKG